MLEGALALHEWAVQLSPSDWICCYQWRQWRRTPSPDSALFVLSSDSDDEIEKEEGQKEGSGGREKEKKKEKKKKKEKEKEKKKKGKKERADALAELPMWT